MKIIFFIAGIFFFSTTFSQQKILFGSDHNIQRYSKKKNEERLTGLFKSQRPAINTMWYWGSPPDETFLLLTVIQPQKDYMHSPGIIGEGARQFDNYCNLIVRTPPNEWEIKPLTEQKLKELRDFLNGSKSNYRSYFN